MYILLVILSPVLAALVLFLHLFLAVRQRERLGRLLRALERRLLARTESADLWQPTAGPAPAKGEAPRKGLRDWPRELILTRAGRWGIVASLAFLVLWIRGWTSPGYPLGFLHHFLGSWALGAALAACAAVVLSSALKGLGSLRAGTLAAPLGLRRLWKARAGRSGRRFQAALGQAVSGSTRIDLLDFTGHELLAKGTSDTGGVLAAAIAGHPTAEVRVLLFNPCTREIDPDRKQTTVVQSQLTAMELSREAFEQKIQATLDRIDVLNRSRGRPIEVRLYSEKPSFRSILLEEAAFLGAYDPRDASGEIPLCEVCLHDDGASLFPAIRAHFARVWADSLPLKAEESQAAAARRPQEDPVPAEDVRAEEVPSGPVSA